MLKEAWAQDMEPSARALRGCNGYDDPLNAIMPTCFGDGEGLQAFDFFESMTPMMMKVTPGNRKAVSNVFCFHSRPRNILYVVELK